RLQPRRVRLGQGDAVVVGQFLAGADIADRLDVDPVQAAVVALGLHHHRLAVGVAAVVDPARIVALVVGVDHVLVVEGEQEGVAALHVAGAVGGDLGMGAALAPVLDDALALADGLDGKYAVAVDGRLAGGDLAGHGRSRRQREPAILAHAGAGANPAADVRRPATGRARPTAC